MEELRKKLGTLVTETMLSDKQTSHYSESMSEMASGTFSQASDVISEISNFDAYMGSSEAKIHQKRQRK